jgi:tetratricopeptide (TPR) repeat protein
MSALAVLCALAAASGCSKSPVAMVDFTYHLSPKSPLSEQYMRIAVRNTRIEGTGEFDQKKWSEMAADMIQHNLERASEEHNIPLKLVDREHMKMAVEEKDMAAAGITDSGDDVASSALAGAAAIITSKVTIKIDKQKGKGRTVDAFSAFGSAWGGGGSVNTTEVEKESRNITVQCQFQLKDAGSNEVIASHSGKPSQYHNKAKRPGFFMGSSKTEADMEPRDQIIGALIEKQLHHFMAKFVPTELEAECEVEASSHDMSKEAVSALVVDDYETALHKFKMAIAEEPTDHKSLFGAGVACEKLKHMDEALKYYKMARSYDAKEAKYTEAVERLSDMS